MGRRLFSRSYEAILPSSLTMIHSSALGYSPRLPVSVYGTGTNNISLEVFLGSLVRVIIHAPEGLRYYHSSARMRICLHSYTYKFQRTIPSVRRPFTTPSPHHCHWWYRNINLFSIDYPFRVRLRSRLTLIRLALIRNP